MLWLVLHVSSALVTPSIMRPPPIEVETGKFWEFDPSNYACFSPVPVHYSVSRRRRDRRPPVVFLHGFGVGEFHFHENMIALDRTSYAFDWIGQGSSWPRTTDDECGLKVCADTWTLQLEHFLEEVVGEPAVLVGNSLGGFLAAIMASRKPDLVAGLGLLNPSPFWGFWPESGSPIWDAALPAPLVPRTVGRTWYDALRDEKNVERMLRTVYACPDRCDAKLVERITRAAGNDRGPSAFASIIFAPKPREDFDDALVRAHDAGIPIGLVYGKDDPWVFPAWGQRAHRRLNRDVPFYELSPTGHCPHHESPMATNLVLQDWLATVDQKPSRFDDELRVTESDGRSILIAKVDGRPRTFFEYAAETIWG